MRRTLAAALIAIAGCGAAYHPPADPMGFVNQTSITDAQLQQLWVGAQNDLATNPIPMNPVTSPNNITYAAPDKRALSVTPDGLDVVEMPGSYFPCPESPTGYCAGLTINSHEIEVAHKYILSPGGTGWEMKNVILMRLGYDVSGR